MALRSFLFSTLCALLFIQCESVNNRPIIGIFGQPASKHGDYIASSYIKWVESAGARAVPIPHTLTTEELEFIFNGINGLLFPGGAADVNSQAKYLYDLAVKANNAGDFFPVWGTCLGFEWLVEMTANDTSTILDTGFDAMNITLALDFLPAARESKMFNAASDEIYRLFGTRPFTMNNHHDGIQPEHFYANEQLSSFYTVLAVNKDRKNVPFVAAMEAKNYPIYGVQFHPEKNAFEYGTYDNGIPYEVVDHSAEAIAGSQYLADFFVSLCRKNTHSFEFATIERDLLVYNYQTFDTMWPGFIQVYIFTKARTVSLIAKSKLLTLKAEL